MKKTLFIFLFLMFILPIVSSKIIFEKQFDELYNIGDSVYVNFSVEKQIPTSGYIETFLKCDGQNLSVYKKYSKIDSGKKYFIFEFPASLKGNCNIGVKFDNEAENSEEFEISDEIIINYNLNNKFFFPLEKMIINGTAIKKNGELLEGIIIVSIQDMENKTIEAKSGKFFSMIEIKKDAFPKSYSIQVEALEKNIQEEIINYGRVIEKIEIKPKPAYIEIEAKESIKLPANISIRAKLLDQTKNLLENETIIIKLFNPDREIVLEKPLKSNELILYFFGDNATRGGWDINAYYGSVYSVKPIYVEEHKKLEIGLLNDSFGSYIKIKNIGNIGYEGVVKISVENSSHSGEVLINLNLSVSGELKYPLNFEGYYNLSIGENKFDNVYLNRITGAAVASKMKLKFRSYIFSFILIFCLVMFYVLFKKRKLNESREKKKTQKRAYMVFFKFDRYFEGVEKIVKFYNFSLNKLNENLYFILFYSSPEENQERKLYNLAKKIREKANSKGCKSSIAVNSCEFVNSGSFLKKFALINRKIVEFTEGVSVTENIFSKLKVPCKEQKLFRFDGEAIKVYVVE